jgi:Transposase
VPLRTNRTRTSLVVSACAVSENTISRLCHQVTPPKASLGLTPCRCVGVAEGDEKPRTVGRADRAGHVGAPPRSLENYVPGRRCSGHVIDIDAPIAWKPKQGSRRWPAAVARDVDDADHPRVLVGRDVAVEDDRADEVGDEGTRHMILVDMHKRNHMLVAVDGQTGAPAGQRAIAASHAGSLDALRFAAGLGQEQVWGIEDCRHVSARLEAASIAAGERVVPVSAAMTSQARKVSRQAGTSDPIDARGAALAVVRDGIESFPVAFTDAQAMEIRRSVELRASALRAVDPEQQPPRRATSDW